MRKIRDEETNKLVHMVNEKKELDVMILEITTKLKPLIEEKKKLEDDTKIKRLYALYKKKLDAYKISRGKKGLIRSELEKKLVDYGVHRPP